MNPYYEQGGTTIYHGHALEVLRDMPDKSVNCCVTSPPYWGLRDYGIPPSVWGGDPGCEHDFMLVDVPTEVGKGNWAQGTNGRGELQQGGVEAKREPIRSTATTGFCIHCGAWRGCLGLEPTPELFIEHTVQVFREVRRVLRDDGTLWLNIGDSYANDGKWGGETGGKAAYIDDASRKRAGREKRFTGLKPKDLVGIPWMLAFALRADGWYLRQDIIWHKPNPMPESVRDRCTKAHEYIFLLSKSQRYYYDADSIKDACVCGDGDSFFDQGKTAMHQQGKASGNKRHKCVAAYEASDSEEHRTKAGLLKISDTAYATRNRRSVWTVATEPFPEAHFATFPTELIKPCILAGPTGGTVLDPFAGSGTTMQVARDLNCKSVGIELNAEYIEILKRRLRQDTLNFTPEGEHSATT